MTTVDLLEALKQQRARLERLLESKIWISDAPKATIEEMNAQVAQIKSLIQEIDDLIQARRR
jgi:replicative DNA helicase